MNSFNKTSKDATANSLLALSPLDLALVSPLLMCMMPLLLIRAGLAVASTGRVFEKQILVGKDGRPVRRLSFAGAVFGKNWAVLFNILGGELSFTGPRALTENEAAAVPAAYNDRFSVVPGLYSTWLLKQRTGIDYSNEWESDCEFVANYSSSQRLALLIKLFIAALLSGGRSHHAPADLHMLGVRIDNNTMQETLDWIEQQVQTATLGTVAFVNPDCLNKAYTDIAYRDVLNSAAKVLPDGIGIRLGGSMLGWQLRANVNGTDLFPLLCERAAQTGMSIFLLGARPGLAQKSADAMCERYPGLHIAGVQHGYFDANDTANVINKINTSGADILLVAMGAPRQELWLQAHRHELTPAVRIGVGGLFDFYSNRIPRAPLWLREVGLEWTWRLLQEPSRMWRRYLIGNPLFLFRIWKQRAASHQN